MNLPASINLGTTSDGRAIEYAVEVPKSYAVRYDLAAAARVSTHRATASACALCCPKLARDLKVRAGADILAHGGDVIDAWVRLVDEHKLKSPSMALVSAGTPLLLELMASLTDGDEVDAVEGFSAAQPEGSTS